jgi:hypothetical protein
MTKVTVTVSITRRVSASLFIIIIIIKKEQVTGPKTKDGMILVQRAAAFVSFYCMLELTFC